MCAARFYMSMRLPARTAALHLGVLSCISLGCSDSQQTVKAQERAPASDLGLQQEKPLGGVASHAAKPVAVREGTAPLVYLADMPQTIRVIDRTGNLILGETVVGSRTIVRVDERVGVIAGKQTLTPGPLPPGRRYAIYVVPDSTNSSRAGRYQPIPQRKPVSEIPEVQTPARDEEK
jgi:hypothetical protein